MINYTYIYLYYPIITFLNIIFTSDSGLLTSQYRSPRLRLVIFIFLALSRSSIDVLHQIHNKKHYKFWCK